MELELGLKVAGATDDFTSYFQMSKDRAGPVFKSTETEFMFILTAHLKGYERKNVRIDINEDGTIIAISGKRPIREILTVGSKVYKKDTEVFEKVFKIPNGVILDKIKASYNEEESTLKVTMPKKVGGIRGAHIKEIKEERGDELVKEGSSSHLQIGDEHANSQTSNDQEKHEEEKKDYEAEKDVHENDIQEEEKSENEGAAGVESGNVLNDEDHDKAKRCKLCVPIVAAGSTLLLSFVVFVLHMIRSKNQSKRD